MIQKMFFLRDHRNGSDTRFSLTALQILTYFLHYVFFFTVITLLSSVFNIAWSYSSYYRSNREVAGEYIEDINFIVLSVYFLAAVGCLASRFFSCTLFVVIYRKDLVWMLIFSIVLVGHFISMLIYISCWLKPYLKGTVNNRLGHFAYHLLFSYVAMFLFMNLGGERSSNKMKKQLLIRYGIIHFETLLLSVRLLTSGFQNIHLYIIYGVVVPIIIHIILLLLFYGFFHPKTGKYKEINNINPFRVCLCL